MEYTLVMTFICENGEKVSMSVSGVNGNITGTEVGELMDIIVEKNIFETKGGNIAKKHSANLTEKIVRNLTIA